MYVPDDLVPIVSRRFRFLFFLDARGWCTPPFDQQFHEPVLVIGKLLGVNDQRKRFLVNDPPTDLNGTGKCRRLGDPPSGSK